MIHAEPADGVCTACGDDRVQRVVAMTIGATVLKLCPECGNHAARTLYDKFSILHSSVPSPAEVSSSEVARIATYPLGVLLDDLVVCSVNYHVGPLDADKRRIATAFMERLASLEIARKMHRSGCEIWPKYSLCKCPWEVSS